MSFSTSRKLRFGDCDPAGIAYFPSYLDLLVGVVEEFFEHIGAPWPQLIGKSRIGVPTVSLTCAFKRPALHGSMLDFSLSVRGIGRTSLDLDHAITSEGTALWTAEQRLVATSLDTHRSCPWPEELRKALALHLQPSGAE